MKDKADRNIDRALIVTGILFVILVALHVYDAIVNAPKNVPIIIRKTTDTITTDCFTNVPDLLCVLSNDNYEIYTK